MSPEHESDLVTALHEAVERARVLHGREMAQKLARPSHTEYGYWSARVGRFISLDDPEPFARLGYQVLQREVTDWQPYQQETNPWRCDDNGFLGCDWSEDHDGEGVYWDAAGQRTETR